MCFVRLGASMRSGGHGRVSKKENASIFIKIGGQGVELWPCPVFVILTSRKSTGWGAAVAPGTGWETVHTVRIRLSDFFFL